MNDRTYLTPAVAVPVAMASGALVAVQQRFNGELGRSLGDPLLAAVISFGGGLVLMCVLVVRRLDVVAHLRDVPWWTRLGGLGGATLVGVGAAAAPKIGVALLTVGMVSGTMVTALAVDRTALVPGEPRPLTPARLLGAAMCLGAIVLASKEGLRSASALLLALVVAAGGLVSLQQALNGRVRAATDATVATFLNFVVGTTALLLAFAGQAVAGHASATHWPSRFWLYLGGPIGCVFIALAALFVSTLGVLRFGLATTAGQLLGGVLLDLDRGVPLATLAAVVLTLLAVLVSGQQQLARAPA